MTVLFVCMWNEFESENQKTFGNLREIMKKTKCVKK